MPERQPQHPTNDDQAAWKEYWQALDLPWRTEPEIDQERQAYLAERRAVKPDTERGIYPFRDENGSIKLTRADVEWLLATHKSGGILGPVNWDDGRERHREGLDLRGSDVRAVDLSRLPLARLRAGLGSGGEWHNATVEQREASGAQMQGVSLEYAHLEGAHLSSVHLEKARVGSAHLEGSRLRQAHLGGAAMHAVFFDTAANISGVRFGHKVYGAVSLSDVRWGGVGLATVNWAYAHRLGDERDARMCGGKRNKPLRLVKFRAAVRANRQLAVALRAQGLNEESDSFAYQAQVLQRSVLRQQAQWLRWLGSLVFDSIAGYGYRPLRSIATYVLVVLAFAAVYFVLAPSNLHLTAAGAIVTSMVSFHGRGFFPGQPDVDGLFMRFVAAEALCGLLIEITFIATFTQRFFAR
jgi:uncharacterized protein YjbI with pentapeptide repeats